MIITAQHSITSYSFVRYLGDLDTHVVHRETCVNATERYEVFLDIRTALVRGYKLCGTCQHK